MYVDNNKFHWQNHIPNFVCLQAIQIIPNNKLDEIKKNNNNNTENTWQPKNAFEKKDMGYSHFIYDIHKHINVG